MEKKEEVLGALKEFLNDPDLTDDTLFQQENLDSFDKMNLLVLLEELSGKELSIIELFESSTIGDVIALC